MNRFKGKKLTIDRWGYICYKKKGIHRIIWEEANGPIPEGHQIHHIDGNKYNNAIENLQCMTHSAHRSLHAKLRRDFLSVQMSLNNEMLHEWHRSQKGRKRLSENGKRQWKNRSFKSFTCEQCKKEFNTKHVTHVKYCSDKCVMRARNKRGIDNVERLCVICSASFTINKYQKTKTCSFACRNKLISHLKNKKIT